MDPMGVEVSVALNYVISYLYNKLPRRRVDAFAEELDVGIKIKFQGHWYTDKPFKGSAFRCLRVSGDKVDPVVTMAAVSSGLNLDEMKEFLPQDLTLWIDPGEVSYRIGEKGTMTVLYSTRNKERELEEGYSQVESAIQRDAQIDELAAGLSHGMVMSPESPPPQWTSPPPSGAQSPDRAPVRLPLGPFVNKQRQSAPLLTVSQFAQTKFGSSKLKSSNKRPSRLSPTELSLLKQRTGQAYPTRPQELDLATHDAFAQQDYLAHQRALWAQHLQQHSPISPQQATVPPPAAAAPLSLSPETLQPPKHAYQRSLSSPLGAASQLVVPFLPLSSSNSDIMASLNPVSSAPYLGVHSASMGSLATAPPNPYSANMASVACGNMSSQLSNVSDAHAACLFSGGQNMPVAQDFSPAFEASLSLPPPPSQPERLDPNNSLGLTDLVPPSSPPAYDAFGLSGGHLQPMPPHTPTSKVDEQKAFFDGLNLPSLPSSRQNLAIQHLLVAN